MGRVEKGSDNLPYTIGNPATTALAVHGITKLSQLTDWTERELLEFHGVGPKAISILRKELEEQGLRFRQE